MKKYIPILLGILFVAGLYIPYFLLGKGSVVSVTDQLDGEIVAYFLHAKHFLNGSSFLPEYMCGVNGTALMPPSFLTVLLYVLFPAFPAFFINQYLMLLTACVGMYLLCEKLTGRPVVSMITAGLFTLLPFYSVYGLCIAGLPLFAYACIRLSQNERKVLSLAVVLLYSLTSSFVLTGYAVLAVLCLSILILFFRKKRVKELIFATFLLTVSYLGQNFDLISGILGLGTTQLSHKEEIKVFGMSFWEGFLNAFLNGLDPAVSYHRFLILPVVLLLIWGIIKWKKIPEALHRKLGLVGVLFLSAVGIALFYGLFHWNPVVALRNEWGGALKYFQMDRFYWFYPFIWYLLLACFLDIVPEVCKKRVVAVAICSTVLAATGFFVLWNSNFKKNVRQLLNPATSNQITWEKYFAENLFTRIDDYILKTDGVKKEEYRVASIGIQPAVPVLNGFYTIDGYSNNYSLSYKHAFREIMETELAQNEYNRLYFDDWGNRCYLFPSDYNGGRILGKDSGVVLKEFSLNTEVLQQLNCRYLFSGAEISEPEKTGLKLQEVFEDDFYRIYLYKVM